MSPLRTVQSGCRVTCSTCGVTTTSPACVGGQTTTYSCPTPPTWVTGPQHRVWSSSCLDTCSCFSSRGSSKPKPQQRRTNLAAEAERIWENVCVQSRCRPLKRRRQTCQTCYLLCFVLQILKHYSNSCSKKVCTDYSCLSACSRGFRLCKGSVKLLLVLNK